MRYFSGDIVFVASAWYSMKTTIGDFHCVRFLSPVTKLEKTREPLVTIDRIILCLQIVYLTE